MATLGQDLTIPIMLMLETSLFPNILRLLHEAQGCIVCVHVSVCIWTTNTNLKDGLIGETLNVL